MKKILPILCAAVLLLSFAACTSNTDSDENTNESEQNDNVLDNSETTNNPDENTDNEVDNNVTDTPDVNNDAENTDYSNTTLTGQVTTIDGSSVILQLGELTENDSENIPIFTSGVDTATLDLTGAAIMVESADGSDTGTISDISTGDILVVEVGDNNTVTSVTVKNFDDSGNSQNNSEVQDGDSQDL